MIREEGPVNRACFLLISFRSYSEFTRLLSLHRTFLDAFFFFLFSSCFFFSSSSVSSYTKERFMPSLSLPPALSSSKERMREEDEKEVSPNTCAPKSRFSFSHFYSSRWKICSPSLFLFHDWSLSLSAVASGMETGNRHSTYLFWMAVGTKKHHTVKRDFLRDREGGDGDQRKEKYTKNIQVWHKRSSGIFFAHLTTSVCLLSLPIATLGWEFRPSVQITASFSLTLIPGH